MTVAGAYCECLLILASVPLETIKERKWQHTKAPYTANCLIIADKDWEYKEV